MNLSELSIRRPTFITCLVLAMLAVGYICMQKMGVDQFPDVTFPIVIVSTSYPGAGPGEIERLVSKPLEDEIGTLSGIKRLRSINREGKSTVLAEFTLETDVKYAEQQVRDHVGSARRVLPKDIKEPVITRVDPADQPVAILSLSADLPAGKLYDAAYELVRPRLEQVDHVGLVNVIGGRKREIRVELDRLKLKQHEVSATQVANRLAAAGENTPSGSVNEDKKEILFRTIGEFKTLKDVEDTIISFYGNERPVRVRDVAKVTDSLADEQSRVFVNGEKTLFLFVFRQSGANTISVVDAVKKRVETLNIELNNLAGKPHIKMVRDGARYIRANVTDVKESIFLGIFLTIIVVFFFLGNLRSTIITGLAIPNSLIGAFILMSIFGFTINVMSLLALSLSIGLLIDDAIVVRENIFRHIEQGKKSILAALEGTAEVRLAVIATTLTVIAVFGPVGFLKGVTGQFFKQFGLTICFVMAISLFDALTIAPMLSAYFAGVANGNGNGGILSKIWKYTLGGLASQFSRLQDRLTLVYEHVLRFVLKFPGLVLVLSVFVFIGSFSVVKFVPKTFLPTQDNGEFMVSLEADASMNLETMTELSLKVEKVLRSNKEIAITSLVVGGKNGESNIADFYVQLVPFQERKFNTSEIKERLRGELKAFSYANPTVKDYDAVGSGQRAFNLEIIGATVDEETLVKTANAVFERVKAHPGLKDVDIDYKPGKPEFQVHPKQDRAQALGISTIVLGQELHTQIEGDTPAKFRENGLEYDIRVRLREDQRNLRQSFLASYIPNINNSLLRLSDIATPFETTSPSKTTRIDRGRNIDISADITPGAGLGDIMKDVSTIIEKDVKLPVGMRYMFIGQAENFKELSESMTLAVTLAVLFIFLILASLYESFVTPLTIMLALPLAICGCFFGLFVTHQSLNIFSMIGAIMLLGVATKNSILLVDYAKQMLAKGMSRSDALIAAGKTRLRPILMTTMALIAGTMPVALGLNEASKQRVSMGIAIIGGLISSTILTLLVVPAAFSFLDRFRVWSKALMYSLFAPKKVDHTAAIDVQTKKTA